MGVQGHRMGGKVGSRVLLQQVFIFFNKKNKQVSKEATEKTPYGEGSYNGAPLHGIVGAEGGLGALGSVLQDKILQDGLFFLVLSLKDNLEAA